MDAGDAQAAFFSEQGYLPVPELTGGEELRWLGEAFDRLFAERAGAGRGDFLDLAGKEGRPVLPQILNPQRYLPGLWKTRAFLDGRRLAARLLAFPEEALDCSAHLILKPAGYGHETPWHQDEAYWDPAVAASALSVWMPLEPARVESGCLQFIPGSHGGEVLPHRHIGDDPAVHGLWAPGVDASRAVACPLPAGGASVHHCRTLHYAGPNLTERPRRAVIHVFKAPRGGAAGGARPEPRFPR